MPRVSIEEPQHYLFAAHIVTRITDLNYGGHVGNDKIFSYMHDARVQWFKHLGYQHELDFGQGDKKLGTIQTDAAIIYKKEIFEHESITIHIGCVDFNKYGCDFVYKFMKSDGSIAAIGKTGIVFFDYDFRKISPWPEQLRAQLMQA
jgi:acyl-CoA thioester hydrolase